MYPSFFYKPLVLLALSCPDSSRSRLSGIVILISSMLLSMSCQCFAHELPDGFVERGIAVVVREDFARIEYRIGASDATMLMQLAEWKIDADSLTGEELRQCFADSALASLPHEMRIFVDGRALEFVPIDARVGGQHHVSAVIAFEVLMPEIDGLARLRIEDHAFGNLDGAIRLAFKSTGGVMTRNSKFAPVLVRADRQVLPLRSATGRKLPVQLGARMVFSAGKKVDSPEKLKVENGEIRQSLADKWLDEDSPPVETSDQ